MNWFCLRTRPKHEHIAAAHLAADACVETFLPRIRFRRPTRRGPVWFTEALFPSYLFARFDLPRMLRHIQHIHGIQEIVHFGEHWPHISEEAIKELMAIVGPDALQIIDQEPEPGDHVRITAGAFQGLQAVVTRVMPGPERVAVLLEFLGRQTPVEVACAQVVREADHRGRIAGKWPTPK